MSKKNQLMQKLQTSESSSQIEVLQQMQQTTYNEDVPVSNETEEVVKDERDSEVKDERDAEAKDERDSEAKEEIVSTPESSIISETIPPKGYELRPERKSARIQLRLPPYVLEKTKLQANVENTSVSEWILQAINEKLDK